MNYYKKHVELLIIISITVFMGVSICTAGTIAETQVNSIAIESLKQLKAKYAEVQILKEGNTIKRLYGSPFGNGSTPKETAESFVNNSSHIWGVDKDNLSIGKLTDKNMHTQPVMYIPETDSYKFTLVYYSQYQNGIPVFNSELKLLVRNDKDYPLVLASSSLRDLGTFQVDKTILNKSLAAFENVAQLDEPELTTFGKKETVIWAGLNSNDESPRTAVKFIGYSGNTNAFLYIIDAETGEILHKESKIWNFDVTGTVQGMATEPSASDYCNDESLYLLPYAKVSIGGSTVYTDSAGNYIISHTDSASVQVQSTLEGEFFKITNHNGTNALLTESVVGNGQVNFTHNQLNSSEFNRAEVNAYYFANDMRNKLLKYNPLFPGVHDQSTVEINVNMVENPPRFNPEDTSIILSSSDAGSTNAAFQFIIQHEYIHCANYLAGHQDYGDGSYAEGIADCVPMVFVDNPILGQGFNYDCNVGTRNADNDAQYPPSAGAHEAGLILSGCVWDTRNELILTEPENHIDILANLTINSILLKTGTDITPQITIDFLILDDDDGNLSNGTPHYQEIATGFAAHNMDAPNIVSITSIPVRNAINVSQSSSIIITFDDAMDEATLNSNTFQVASNKYGQIDGTLIYISAGNFLIFDPLNDLSSSDIITVTLTNNISTVSGTPLFSGNGYSYSFSTSSCSNGIFADDEINQLSSISEGMISADFNKDGLSDIASFNSNNDSITISINNGFGEFPTNISYKHNGFGTPNDIQAADIDGDGNIDLITSNYPDSSLTIFYISDSGIVLSQSDVSISYAPWASYPSDMDNDGDMDIVISYSNPSIRIGVLYNDGAENFSLISSYSTNSLTGIITTDFNSDGILDIIPTVNSTYLTAFLSDGTGGYDYQGYFSRGNYFLGINDVVTADFDGNGTIDMAASVYSTSDVGLLLGDGIGGFTTLEPLNIDNHPNSIVAADFDGDGDIDIATTHESLQKISILWNNGDATFSAFETEYISNMSNHLIDIDIDGNGSVDFIAAHTDSSSFSVIKNLGAPLSPVLYSPLDGKNLTAPATPFLNCNDVETASYYYFEIDDDSSFGSPLHSSNFLNVSEWTVSSSLTVGTYYWRAKAANTCGYGSWSDVWHIVVENPPPPSCPVLYSFDGTDFVQENPLLTACEQTNYKDIVTDYYQLNSTIAPKDGKITFQLREMEDEITTLNNVELITVDHSATSNIGCTVDGQIFAYNASLSPISAIDQNGIDWIETVKESDNNFFKADQAGYLIVTYPNLGSETGIAFGAPPKIACLENPIGKSIVEEIEKQQIELYKFTVEQKSSDGVWIELPTVPTRVNATGEFVMTDLNTLQKSDELIIRISWDNQFITDEIRQYLPSDENPIVTSWTINSYNVSSQNTTAKIWAGFDSAEALELRKDELIEFSFNVNELNDPSLSRTYIIRAVGKYEPDYSVYTNLIPNKFKLLTNYPNPFNPTTTISYNMPVKSHVTLEVINLLGQTIKTLVDQSQASGQHSVIWDGKNSQGNDVASGVYFYRISTDSFTDSKKMMLMK